VEESEDYWRYNRQYSIAMFFFNKYTNCEAETGRLEKQLESEQTMRAKLEKQLSDKSQELEKLSEPIKKTSGQNADQIEPKKQEEDDSDDIYEEDQISDLPKKAEKQFDN
jgi:septal ring factor EnvC (AmiA/AmiB activator)